MCQVLYWVTFEKNKIIAEFRTLHGIAAAALKEFFIQHKGGYCGSMACAKSVLTTYFVAYLGNEEHWLAQQ